MKPYLFAYSQMCPDWHAQAILDDTREVTNWVRPFPHAAIVVSTLSAKDLAAALRMRLGQTWFLVSEVDGATADGLLPANLWPFVNNAPTASLMPAGASAKPGHVPSEAGAAHGSE